MQPLSEVPYIRGLRHQGAPVVHAVTNFERTNRYRCLLRAPWYAYDYMAMSPLSSNLGYKGIQLQVLLDSEGTEASDQSDQYMAQLFAMCILFSSVFVYNHKGFFEARAFKELSLVATILEDITAGMVSLTFKLCVNTCEFRDRTSSSSLHSNGNQENRNLHIVLTKSNLHIRIDDNLPSFIRRHNSRWAMHFVIGRMYCPRGGLSSIGDASASLQQLDPCKCRMWFRSARCRISP